MSRFKQPSQRAAISAWLHGIVGHLEANQAGAEELSVFEPDQEPITRVDLTGGRNPIKSPGWIGYFGISLGYIYFTTRSIPLVLIGVSVFGIVLLWGRFLALIVFPQGIVVRNWFVRRHIPWSELDRAIAVREKKRSLLALVLKDGKRIVPRALQVDVSDDIPFNLLNTVGAAETINFWVSQHRAGLLVELSNEPRFPHDIAELLDDIYGTQDRLEVLSADYGVAEEGADIERLTAEMETLAEELKNREMQVVDLLRDRLVDGREFGLYPHRRGSNYFYALSAIPGAFAVLMLAVAAMFGPFGTTVSATVVAHEGKSDSGLNTIVQFIGPNGLERHEIFRNSDSPPYTPVGSELRVVHSNHFPAVVADAQDMNSLVATGIAAIAGLVCTMLWAVGRWLRFGKSGFRNQPWKADIE